MKHQPHLLFAITVILMTGCTNKNSTGNKELKQTFTAPMIIPSSPDTLMANGRRNIFLVGRREEPGLFVERAIFPPAYKSNPHTHQGNLNITVITGSFNLALSSNPDSATIANVYGPGSFVIIPANQPHFEWFTETTVMDITGIGPLKTMNLTIVHSSK